MGDKNNLQLNESKSAILELKTFNRTANKLPCPLEGIEVKTSYKFLGIILNCNISFKMNTKHFNQNRKKLKGLTSMHWAKQLPQNLQFISWHAYVDSKFNKRLL